MSKSEQGKLRHKLAHILKAKNSALPWEVKPAPPEAKHHGTLRYVADSARLAGFMASVAIGQSFSGGKANPIGIWFGILAACAFALVFVHGLAERRKEQRTRSYFFFVGLPMCFTALCYGWWLSQPPLMRIVFKNPSGFISREDPVTRVKTLSYLSEFLASRQLTHFAVYMSNIGFDVPKTIPPIGVGEATTGWTGTKHQTMTFSSPDFANEHELVFLYAGTILAPLIMGDVRPLRASKDGEMHVSSGALRISKAVGIYSDYFACSYLDTISWVKTPNGDLRWLRALWDLRAKLTKNVVDHALLYGIGSLREGYDDSPDTDTLVGLSVLSGVAQMSSDEAGNYYAALTIFEKRGIRVTLPKMKHERVEINGSAQECERVS